MSDTPEQEHKTNFFELVETVLRENFDMRYNTVSNEIEVRPVGEDDFKPINDSYLYVWLRKKNVNVRQGDLQAIIRSGFVEEYNPFDEYFKSLSKWDGSTDHIRKLCSYLELSAHDETRFYKQFRKMLIRTIACALEESVFNKHIFVLVQQQQSGGKSTFLRWLCPQNLQSYYTENFSFDKDGSIALCENLIVNFDEMAALQKTEINQLKTIFSKLNVKVRRPYDKKASPVPRRCSFVGSTNNMDFLNDPTGSVRFICFNIHKINWAYTSDVDINQVWAMAYALYKEKEKYELTKADIEENELANKLFQRVPPEVEFILKHYAIGSKEQHQTFVTTTDILRSFTEHYAGMFKSSVEAIGRAMTQCGHTVESVYKSDKKYSLKGYHVNPPLY